MASDQPGDDSTAACDAVGDAAAVETLEFTGIPAGDMECFVWLVLRTEYEAMGLSVLEHEADEDSRAWTDPPIRMQDGREYVYLYPDNVMDLLRAPRGEPVRLRITKLVTGNKGTGQ